VSGWKIVALLVLVATAASFGMALVMKRQAVARKAQLQAPR
jgi:hypothetical protein